MIIAKIYYGIAYTGVGLWEADSFEITETWEENYDTIEDAINNIESRFSIFDYEISNNRRNIYFWVY